MRQLSRAAIATSMLVAAPVAAQERFVVTPSMSIGAAYDENVFAHPDAQSDHVWRVSPAVSFTRQTPRTNWVASMAADGEWFSRHRDLTTVLARQHASSRAEWKVDPSRMLILSGGYNMSLTPSELNVGTGLGLGRTRASRWFAAPAFAQAFGPRLRANAGYTVSGDVTSIGPGAVTHEAAASVLYRLDPRTDIGLEYGAEWFDFDFDERGIVRSHTAGAVWQWRVTPRTRVTTVSGLRAAGDRIRPEIEASVSRQATFSEARLAYAWTQTTAVGVAGLVEVQRLSASFAHRRQRGIGISLEGGIFLNDLGIDRADVYRVAAEVISPAIGVVSLGASYAFELQRAVTAGIPTGAEVGSMPRPPLVLPDADRELRRNVFLVRLIFSGSIRRAAGPSEPIPEPVRELPPNLEGAGDRRRDALRTEN